jgi:putative transposase
VKNLVHLIYSTKNRRPCIKPAQRESLFAYQAGIYREWDSAAIVIGGEADHVHALFALSKNHALKRIVEEVKKGSSIWAKVDGPMIPDFQWQAGYAAFSVSESNAERVREYIENQDKHHQRITFQEELRALLRRHGIVSDERYVWD